MKNKNVLILAALMVFIVLLFTAYYLGAQRNKLTSQATQIQNKTINENSEKVITENPEKIITEEEIRVIQKALAPKSR